MPFRVERELKVTVTPLKDVYAPGATGKVRIKAVDQLGHPVRAELSLALVDEALFALFPDRTPKILEFFQKGAVRFTDFRVVGTSGFRYVGRTRAVVKALPRRGGAPGASWRRRPPPSQQLGGTVAKRSPIACGTRSRARGPLAGEAGRLGPGGGGRRRSEPVRRGRRSTAGWREGREAGARRRRPARPAGGRLLDRRPS